METLLVFLMLCMTTATGQPEVVTPGPKSGIVLRDQQGLLITNCRTYTQKVYVRLNPAEVYRKHISTGHVQTSWAGWGWTQDTITHAEADTKHMLQQLEKFTVTRDELTGHNKRSKRFIATLLTAAAAVGSLFSLGTSGVNAVSIHSLKKQVGELQADLPNIRQQIAAQANQLQTVGRTLQGTVVIVNTHSNLINQTVQAVERLRTVVSVDYAHTQIVNMLMTDMLREISSSVDSLAMGRIPPYLVPLSLVQKILAKTTGETITSTQAHLAYSLGSAVSLFVDPENRELAFLLSLPVVDNRNIYRLKDVVNVGSWHDDTYIRISTPPVVAYHDSSPDLYLAPNLLMCTKTKDIHYLCPSKPFVKDNTDGICGLKPMKDNTRCRAEATARPQVLATKAEIVGARWLVHTPALFATMSYDLHDTSTRIPLPNQTFWADVPPDAILHVDNMALYHLAAEHYEGEIEISEFFSQYKLRVDPTTKQQISQEGTQVIDLTPLDAVLQTTPTSAPDPDYTLAQAWTKADTLTCVLCILGYSLTGAIAFWSGRRFRGIHQITDRLSKVQAVFSKSRRGPRAAVDEPGFLEAPLREVAILSLDDPEPFQGDSGTLQTLN